MHLTAQQLEAQMPDATQLLSDEPEMESSLHYQQLALLVKCLEWLWRNRNDFFIGANLTIYFSRQQLKNRDFRGPDFFLVKGTQKRDRASWVLWEEEGKYPDLIIELLSASTAQTDKTIKKNLYQNRFRTPEYFWFDPEDLEFAGFRLVGEQYQAIASNDQGWLWSEVLDLYLGVTAGKLRYFTLEGFLVPTPEETAEQEHQLREIAQQQAEQERQLREIAQQQAEQERQRAELLAEQLRSLGIDPDS